jgi:poly(3-hydroxyalkanoate) synthetase
MLKKDVVIKWSLEEKSTFQRIKQALVEAPVLVIPDYAKEFFIFSLTSEETIVVVYCKRMKKGMNIP